MNVPVQFTETTEQETCRQQICEPQKPDFLEKSGFSAHTSAHKIKAGKAVYSFL